jgi:hypothetical protein
MSKFNIKNPDTKLYCKLDDSLELECQCNNPLDHWMQNTNSKVSPICSVYGCTNKSIVGGFLKVFNSNDSEVFMLPICIKHLSHRYKRPFKLKQTRLKKAVHPRKLKNCRPPTSKSN